MNENLKEYKKKMNNKLQHDSVLKMFEKVLSILTIQYHFDCHAS